MKLLTEDLLTEYGFVLNCTKTVRYYTVYSRDKMDIVLRNDETFYYSKLGIDYPIRDTATLRKLYKEIRCEDLKPLVT